jgi:carbon-monoxide dehydrogenase medium subunit
MKPHPFDYYAPATIDQVIELLKQHGQDARVLAGGQSLVPMLNFRLSAPSVMIDLNRVAGMSHIREEGGHLHFGAMTRQRAIEFSPLVANRLPIMLEATRLVGHLPTRTRGTIGGSIAHADPSAEYPTLMVALSGEMVLQGQSGRRIVGADAFFQGPMATVLRCDELIVEVRIPVMPRGAGWAFEEFSRRHGDFAIVESAVMVASDGDRLSARVAVSGEGGAPRRLRPVEEIIERDGLGPEAIGAASARAMEIVDPVGDLHADASYRRHLTGVIVRRALVNAARRIAPVGN